jgi:hypothetical protein
MSRENGMAAGNGNSENGDAITVRPTTLLLDLLQRQAISETQLSTIISEQNEARESRRLMHEKLDGVGREFAALGQEVKTTTAEVDALRPKVAEHERLRQNFNGGLIVLGGLASIILVSIGFVLKEAWGWAAHHVRWN